MKPPTRAKTAFERIPVYDTWIPGKILDIEYDETHKSTYAGEEKIRPAVRFKFGLEGCNFPHRSRWLTFNYGDKSNLYKHFVSALVEDAEPDMDLDLDTLKDMKIKTMWTEDGEYDNLTMIRPLNGKYNPNEKRSEKIEEIPF